MRFFVTGSWSIGLVRQLLFVWGDSVLDVRFRSSVDAMCFVLKRPFAIRLTESDPDREWSFFVIVGNCENHCGSELSPEKAGS